MSINEPTTNAAIRARFEAGDTLNDGAPLNALTDAPANGAATVVDAAADIHVVTADGTNTADLSNAEEAGREVTVVHDGGSNTPTVTFTAGDFTGSAPGDLTAAGDTARVVNIDGTASGWVEV